MQNFPGQNYNTVQLRDSNDTKDKKNQASLKIPTHNSLRLKRTYTFNWNALLYYKSSKDNKQKVR